MLILEGKEHDLGGGLMVRRVLPQRQKRTVGPFVFLDHMGPLTVLPHQNIDVRPHPHIGLSTLTYLFSGRQMHRDSLGSVASIEPGEVNWMTAGRGISHSERAHEEDRALRREMHGLQFWVGLPDEKEDDEPSFQHYERESIPSHENEERKISVVAGEALGLRSPVKTSSPLMLADIKSKKRMSLALPRPGGFELALYLIRGHAKVAGQELSPLQIVIFPETAEITMELEADSHAILLGGEPFPNPKNIWWNLVSSSKDKIEAAKRQWREGQFPMVPGETEFIPLPE